MLLDRGAGAARLNHNRGGENWTLLKPSITAGPFLLHRKDEIVAIAPVVIRFEGVAAAAEGRPIRQVSEGATDWVSWDVVDRSEDRTSCQRSRGSIHKFKGHTAVNDNSQSVDLSHRGSSPD